jgi:phytanoyl-CoA hydroxylase
MRSIFMLIVSVPSFVEHPALTKFIRDLMGWNVHRILDQTMLRLNVPLAREPVSTTTSYLRGGEGFFLTAWVPIGKFIQCVYQRSS